MLYFLVLRCPRGQLNLMARFISSLMPSKTVYKDILRNSHGLLASLRLQYEQLSSTATETEGELFFFFVLY